MRLRRRFSANNPHEPRVSAEAGQQRKDTAPHVAARPDQTSLVDAPQALMWQPNRFAAWPIWGGLPNAIQELSPGVLEAWLAWLGPYVVCTIDDLGSLGGGFIEASGINDDGQIVGSSLLWGDQEVHAFLWEGGAISDLGSLPGLPGSQAQAISAEGAVIGHCSPNPLGSFGKWLEFDPQTATRWDDRVPTDLGVQVGAVASRANGVSTDGWIVGDAWNPATGGSGLQGGFVITDKQVIHLDPSHIPSTTNLMASFSPKGINASHLVAGQGMASGEQYPSAYLFDGAVARNLGGLPGYWGSAAAISTAGFVAGIAAPNHAGDVWHPVLFAHGAIVDLGTLDQSRAELRAVWASARAINDRSDVVGAMPIGYSSSPTAFGWEHGNPTSTAAFLSRGGATTPIDLNDVLPADSGWYVTEATGINNRGQIVGNGYHLAAGTNGSRAFLLTPRGPQ